MLLNSSFHQNAVGKCGSQKEVLAADSSLDSSLNVSDGSLEITIEPRTEVNHSAANKVLSGKMSVVAFDLLGSLTLLKTDISRNVYVMYDILSVIAFKLPYDDNSHTSC